MLRRLKFIMFYIMRVLVLFVVYLTKIESSTHWIVTEDGFIKPRADSPFEMARPYDLLGFLSQDTRWENIINWYHELAEHQKVLEETWFDLQNNYDIKSDIDSSNNCREAGALDMLDWYASIFEDGKLKHIPEDEYLLDKLYKHHKKAAPDCKKLSSLTFSMFTFEHLEGMMNRENLTAEAEMGLPDRVTSTMTLDQFGHWLSVVLKTNTTSWLHYNMAALYWRAKGSPSLGLECCRRAVYYAPRNYRDIALLNMGIILHRSKKTKDALTVLRAAVDHDPAQYINHYVLGSAHAVIGNFDRSLKYFDSSLKVKPEFWLAFKHRLGVLCHAEMRKKVQFMQKTVVKLRFELKEYTQKAAQWLKTQVAFLRTMKHTEKFDYRNVEKNCAKMSQLTGLDMSEQRKFQDKTSLISYFIGQSMYDNKWEGEKGVFAVDSALNIQKMVTNVLGHAGLVSQYVVGPEVVFEEGDFEGIVPPGNVITELDHNTKAAKQKHQSETNNKGTSEVEESKEFYGGGEPGVGGACVGGTVLGDALARGGSAALRGHGGCWRSCGMCRWPCASHARPSRRRRLKNQCRLESDGIILSERELGSHLLQTLPRTPRASPCHAARAAADVHQVLAGVKQTKRPKKLLNHPLLKQEDCTHEHLQLEHWWSQGLSAYSH